MQKITFTVNSIKNGFTDYVQPFFLICIIISEEHNSLYFIAYEQKM